MAEYNPFFINLEQLGYKPIERFGTYEFTDPKQAAQFMGSENFADFWGKGSVNPSDVAARVEYQTRGRYASPRFNENQLSIDLKSANDRYVNALNNPKTIATEPELRARLNFVTTGARAEGRFYTPVKEDILSYYLNQGVRKATGLQENIPIRVLADERVSRSRLNGERFGGWTSAEGSETHQAGMGAEGARRNLTRVGGRDLGLALSSNPSEEVFVPSNMAKPTAHGGASRVAGRITDAGKIVLTAMPKTSVPLQVARNVNTIGGAIVGKALAPIGLGLQMYGVTRPEGYDKEYGYSDPFSLRPAWDFMGKISGMYEDNNNNPYTVTKALREASNTVKDPEWVARNPISAIPYNAILNTKDFISGLSDAYKPLFTQPAVNRFNVENPFNPSRYGN